MVAYAKEWGTDLIFRSIWEKLGLHSILEKLLAKTEISVLPVPCSSGTGYLSY